MSLLWAVPPVAVAVAVVVALAQLRRIAISAIDLQGELQRFTEVRLAVADVRSASAEARATARRFHRV
jgi:hypothetical protein